MQLWSAHPGSTILQDQSSPPVHSTPFHERYQRVWKPEYTDESKPLSDLPYTRGNESCRRTCAGSRYMWNCHKYQIMDRPLHSERRCSNASVE